MPHCRKAWGKYGTIIAWAIVVCAGWYVIERQSFTQSIHHKLVVVDRWPADSAIERRPDRPTVVLFVHPRCPCTQASLAELERLESSLPPKTRGEYDTVIISTVPTDADRVWFETPAIERARQLNNALIYADRGGREAARFGADISGTVMLFDADGRRRYAGGVTTSRGHEGDNAGRQTVAKILRGEPTTIRDLPVFGCLLCLPGDDAEPSINQITASVASPPHHTRPRSSVTTELPR